MHPSPSRYPAVTGPAVWRETFRFRDRAGFTGVVRSAHHLGSGGSFAS